MNSYAPPQSAPADPVAEARGQHEPSMEEILASIRRIIADDQLLPLTRAAQARSASPAPAPEPVAETRAPVELRPAPREAPPRREPQRFEPQRYEPARRESPRAEAPRMEPPRVEPQRVEPPRVEAARVDAYVEREATRREARYEPIRREPPRQEIPRAAPPPAPQPAAPAPRAAVAPPPPPPAPAPRVEPQVEDAALLAPQTTGSVTSAFNALATSMILQNQGFVEDATRDMLRPMLKQWLDDNLPVIVERLVRAEIERVARGGR